jgi:diguanylate cyclase (GGDEF)-like protein
MSDLDGALRVAEQLRSAIEALMPQVGGVSVRITASIGVARSENSRQTMAGIQHLADQAMYEAKRQGRNRVTTIAQCC